MSDDIKRPPMPTHPSGKTPVWGKVPHMAEYWTGDCGPKDQWLEAYRPTSFEYWHIPAPQPEQGADVKPQLLGVSLHLCGKWLVIPHGSPGMGAYLSRDRNLGTNIYFDTDMADCLRELADVLDAAKGGAQ